MFLKCCMSINIFILLPDLIGSLSIEVIFPWKFEHFVLLFVTCGDGVQGSVPSWVLILYIWPAFFLWIGSSFWATIFKFPTGVTWRGSFFIYYAGHLGVLSFENRCLSILGNFLVEFLLNFLLSAILLSCSGTTLFWIWDFLARFSNFHIFSFFFSISFGGFWLFFLREFHKLSSTFPWDFQSLFSKFSFLRAFVCFHF